MVKEMARVAMTSSNSAPKQFAPTVTIGAPGIGKTAINKAVFASLATELQRPLTYTTQLISGYTEADVRGFPFLQKADRGGEEKLIATWAESSIIAPLWDAYAHHGPEGIYVLDLDELFQGVDSVLKVLGQLLAEGSIGQHTLPPRTIIVGASNAMSHKAGVVRQMTHIINRLFIWPVSFDSAHWQAWAIAQGIHPQYISFVEQHPNLFAGPEALPPAQANAPYLTVRSLTNAERLHRVFEAVEPPPQTASQAASQAASRAASTYSRLDLSPSMLEAISGAIGPGAARTLFAHLEYAEDLPSANEIRTNPGGCKLPPETKPAALVQMMFILPALCPTPADMKSSNDFLNPQSEAYQTLEALMIVADRLPMIYRSQAYGGFVQRTKCMALAMPQAHAFIENNKVIVAEAF